MSLINDIQKTSGNNFEKFQLKRLICLREIIFCLPAPIKNQFSTLSHLLQSCTCCSKQSRLDGLYASVQLQFSSLHCFNNSVDLQTRVKLKCVPWIFVCYDGWKSTRTCNLLLWKKDGVFLQVSVWLSTTTHFTMDPREKEVKRTKV
jgi:hypothetical protein